MDGFERFRKEVRDYQLNHLNLKETKFQPSPLFDLEKHWKDDLYFPNADKSGVYAIFDKNKDLLYLGKASNKSSIGRRLYDHFKGYKKPDWSEEKFKKDWEGIPRYILTYSVEHPFEAPSLEEFLISRLQPKSNSVGRN